MKKNLGSVDRIIRVIITVVVAFLYLTHVITGALGIGLMIAVGVLLATSIVNFCPIYFILGIHSNRRRQVQVK